MELLRGFCVLKYFTP